MSFLFVIPGSALPEEGWFYRLHPDKWIHVGLFAVLLFLWRSSFDWKSKHYNFILFISATLYGLLIEIIQLRWVPNRSFDMYDVLADMAGSVLGLGIWLQGYKKNKPL